MTKELSIPTVNALSLLPVVDNEQSLNVTAELEVLKGLLQQTVIDGNINGSRAILETINRFNKTIETFEPLEPKSSLANFIDVYVQIVADEFGIEPGPLKAKLEKELIELSNNLSTHVDQYGRTGNRPETLSEKSG